MIVIFTESDFICDGNSDGDGQWYGLSLRMIAIVMVCQTVTVIVTESDFIGDSNSDSDGKWLCLLLRVIAIVLVCHWEWLLLW